MSAMGDFDEKRSERSAGRRKEDLAVRDHNQRYQQVFNMGQIVTSEMNMEHLFELIMSETNKIMGTERSTVFLYDENENQLWSLVATGMGRDKIRMPVERGVAGSVFGTRTPLIINDAYKDKRFDADVDRYSGFRTRNILCIPIINRQRDCIGAIEILNKKTGDFSDEDVELLSSISHYVAVALENSKLYEEIKEYAERLKSTLVRVQTLEVMKNQLSKFVPDSVAKMVEERPEELELEKKPMDVSVLFIDIQGFSTITEGFDQKLVDDMVQRHFSKYLDCIMRHKGEVNETSGDGLMVIFKDGSLESSATEAVSAGLEIVTENERLNEELTCPWGKVELHLGVHSGTAWVGSTKMEGLTGERWTYTASGIVTVLAARIGAMSFGSRLYIGSNTYQCVKNHFDCDFIGHRQVKNVKEPITIYSVRPKAF